MDTVIRVKVHRYTYRYHHYNNKWRYASTYTGKDFGCSDNKCPLPSPVSRLWMGLHAKSVVTSAGAGHALVSLQPIMHLLHTGVVAAVTRLKTQVHDVVIVYPPFQSYIGAEAQWLPNYTQERCGNLKEFLEKTFKENLVISLLPFPISSTVIPVLEWRLCLSGDTYCLQRVTAY